MNWSKFLINQLNIQKRKLLWRQRKIIENNNSCSIIFNKRKYINFSSNDYLGLSQHKSIINAWQTGLNKFGTGSGGSSHVIGYSYVHAELEQQLANWLGYSRALLFISGYAANQSIINVLMNKSDYILTDKLIHASILEASMLSPAKLKRFIHNQPSALKKILPKTCAGKILIVTEGIFSMDGDMAPLIQLQSIAKKNNAWLFVDDAHGIGVKGIQGRGSCNINKIKPELLVITFSKACGVYGAALLCNDITAEYFIQHSRHLIYSTFMPAAQALALSEAIIQVRKVEYLRIKLQYNINYFRKLVHQLNIPVLESNTAIQPIIVGNNQRCLKLSQFLAYRGFWVQAIRPPTVPFGSARIRITLLANHKSVEIEQLIETLNDFFKQNGDK